MDYGGPMNYSKKKQEDFHTLKGYRQKNENHITESMEDYLEMICRYAKTDGYARIGVLSSKLNVRPSSASKMVNHLKDAGLVEFEKYGLIKPTQEGIEMGNYLLHRHNVLQEFFCYLNSSECELEQVEQVEHFINKTTLENIEKFMEKIHEKE